MEGSDDKRRIESSFGNCSSSASASASAVGNKDNNNNMLEGNYGRRAVGIPPSHPHSQFGGSLKLGQKPSHSRSHSQPSLLSFDQLPPNMYRESNTTAFDNNVQGLSLPPRRGGGHRRCSSDIPLGFDVSQPEKPAQLVMKREGGGGMGKGELIDDLLSVYMNFDGIDALNSSSSETEVESSGMSSNSVERRGGTHSRSLSMDSFMGNFNLNNDLLSGMPPSPTSFRLDFGNTQFTPQQWNKIMDNQKLAEVARLDPKRVKRILANRVSAARSKERKVRYISELEYKVQTLQTEATSLSAQFTLLQRDSLHLATLNHELRFRLQAMQQHAHLRDALHEALGAELQRLKISAQMKGIWLPQEPMASNRVFQMHPSQNIQEQADSTHSEHRQPAQSQRGGDL